MDKHCIDSPEHNPGNRDIAKQPIENTRDASSLTNAWLPEIINCHDGLLDELLKCGVLDQTQVRQIGSIGNRRLCANKLLNEVKKLSSDKTEQFLSALDKTQQSHVTNFILNNGQRPATTDDNNWPAIDEYIRVHQHWSTLLELIDSRNGLCCELLSAECISFRDKEFLDQYEVINRRNQELLLIVQCKSRGDFKKFIDCLIKTKQSHVAALIDPNIAQNSQPVDGKRVARLIKNFSTLVQLIELKRSGLLNELLSADVITWYQKDFIESASTASESNERLLGCMKRSSQHDYDKFINCLDKTGLQHVAELLRSDGVVVELLAQTSLSSAEEAVIVEQFFDYYHKSSTQKRQQLIDRLLDGLRDNRLIAMQTHHSIKLFFLCESLSGLVHLNELYSTDELAGIIQQLFTVLLKEEQPSVNLRLNSLKWNMSNYNNCLKNLSSLYGLPVFSNIHQWAQQHPLPDVAIEPSDVSLDKKDSLPHELIEKLIIKSAGILFLNMTKLTTRADVHTLTTLNSVCRYWWETLTYRQGNQELLRQLFQHRCAPYRFNPKLITSLRIQDCYVNGVTELDDKLYIVVAESNTIRVRSRVHYSFCELEDMKVPEMINPIDIAACSVTRCLYIIDDISRCIWRVNLSSSLNATGVDRFITLGYEPWKLSFQADRLFVTDAEGPALYIYRCSDGALLRKIEALNDDVIDDDEAQPQIGRLRRYVELIHAVETANGSLFVCYQPRFSDDTEHRPGVSEVSENGQVLRTYEGVTGINRFAYLTVDSRNHILVCDYDNRQILLLNSKLTLQQVLLAELAGLPERVCYREQKGLLYINYYASTNIDVYKVKRTSYH